MALCHARRQMIKTSFPALPCVWANIICAVVIILEEETYFSNTKEAPSCDECLYLVIKYHDVGIFPFVLHAVKPLHLCYMITAEIIGEICKIS